MTELYPTGPGLTDADLARSIVNFRPGFWEGLGATAADAWNNLSPFVLRRFGRDALHQGSEATDEFGLPVGPRIDRPQGTLDEAAWRASRFYREGLEWDRGMTELRAAAIAEEWDTRRYRSWIIQQRGAGPFETAAQFAAAFVGGAPDPINFIPFFGPAFRQAMTARFGLVGGRALVGAGEATLGNLLIEPLRIADEIRYGGDWRFADTLMNLAVGAAAGAALGGTIGAVAARRLRAERAASVEQRQAAGAALAEAADQVARGEAIDVNPRLIEALRQDEGRLLAQILDEANAPRDRVLAEADRAVLAKALTRTEARDRAAAAPALSDAAALDAALIRTQNQPGFASEAEARAALKSAPALERAQIVQGEDGRFRIEAPPARAPNLATAPDAPPDPARIEAKAAIGRPEATPDARAHGQGVADDQAQADLAAYGELDKAGRVSADAKALMQAADEQTARLPMLRKALEAAAMCRIGS